MSLKVFAKEYEEGVVDLSRNLIDLGVVDNVVLMPDTHIGKGSAIGFTAPLGDKIIPEIVGVDIGCGMLVVELGKIDIDLVELDKFIHKNIPAGFNTHKENSYIVRGEVDLLIDKLSFRIGKVMHISNSVGTLGGGNHFIEIAQDDDQNKYLVIHTGSRYLGAKVCEHHQQKLRFDRQAYENARDMVIKFGDKARISGALEFLKTHKNEFNKQYLTDQEMRNYLNDMQVAQKYASLNRYKIAEIICKNYLGGFQHLDAWESVHNYIDFKDKMIRKGATPARKGQKLIIPINMRDGSIIAVGKGNDEWNQSAPHGAGRLMSRKKAKKNLSLDDFITQMKDVHSTTVSIDTLDEAPDTYKSMQSILDQIEPTCEVLKIIKPIYNFKGVS